jgi:predicted RNA-binding Zn ribbon-like protein
MSEHEEKTPSQDDAVYQGRFEFVGEHLSLDFANTLGGLRGGKTEEFLREYADLVAWGQQAGILSDNDRQRLIAEAGRHPSEVQVVLARAVTLREAIYRLFAAVIRRQSPSGDDVSVLNAELALSLVHRSIVANVDGFDWRWEQSPSSLDAVLWPVSIAAADLLISGERRRLRECASEQCSWLFLDQTRNHSRRWCDMKGCGNQAKVRRYRRRQRE